MPDLKKRVLVLSFTDHFTDPRVFRQIEALYADFEVITAGTSIDTHQKTEHIQLIKIRRSLVRKATMAIQLTTHFYEAAYWGQPIVKDAYAKLQKLRVDVIIANDIETLPLALKLAKGKQTKIYFDAHEYAPRQFDRGSLNEFFFASYNDYLCKTYISHADEMTAVCQGIADEYKKVYDVESSVLINAPEYAELTPQEVKGQKIRLIHHGGINAARKIENMIKLVGEQLDERFELDLMLINNLPSMMVKLTNLSNKYPNVRIIKQVPMRDIPKKINEYDIGFYMLPSKTFNTHFALPNKFFEFIQGRLAIAIWPSPEMKRIVDKYQLGIVADDFTLTAMATKLNNLTEKEINQFKKNSHQVASEFNAENCAGQLKSIILRLC